MNDLKKMKNDDLKNLIRKYKSKNCPPYSKLKKNDLIDLIIKLKIPQEISERPPDRQLPAGRSRQRNNNNVVQEDTKKKLLDIVAKKIASKKKQFEKAPEQTAMERRERTGKREKINQKIDELLDIQKYLNRIYRDNINEKVDKEKIKILLK